MGSDALDNGTGLSVLLRSLKCLLPLRACLTSDCPANVRFAPIVLKNSPVEAKRLR